MTRRFGRFSAVGMAGAGVQMLVFGLAARRMPAAAAAALAVELAVLHNFLWHQRFTWRDRPAAGLRERAARLWRFHAANGILSVAGNAAVVWLLAQQLGLPALAAQGAAIAICAPLNFWAADRWVYRCGTGSPAM